MATILYVATAGTNDPTRATMPFVMAQGALEAGHQPEIALIGEATLLMKPGFVDQIHGVGWPALRELFDKTVSAGVPIHV